MELWEMDACDAADRIRAGDLTAVELLESCLSKIDERNGQLNAFVYLDPDKARRTATEIDSKVASGEDPGPLAGIPIGVKDLENAEGMPTTHGSLLYAENIAEFDSIQVSRLRNAGAVILGKTAAPEFGSVSYTRTKLFGTTRNPWSPERTPGGSSGGSAAAVASGMTPLCTGSDGGGSVRIPASYTGLVGPKPTYGLIPEGPDFQGRSHTPHMGPLARSVRDAARYLDVVVGVDPRDMFSRPSPVESFEEAIESTPLNGLRVAYSDTLGFGRADPEVSEIVRAAADDLATTAGLEWVDTDVRLRDPAKAWGIVGGPDLALKIKPFWPDRIDDLTPVVRYSMESALATPPDELARAWARIHELNADVVKIFEEIDLLITPTTATVAYAAEGPIPLQVAGEKVKPMGSLPFTYPFNMTGNPAVSIPAGFNSEDLPVGLQIVARRNEDHLAMAAARALERCRPWPKIAP